MLGHDKSQISWKRMAIVYPPQDMVISSVLQAYGIPVKLRRREISQLPVSIGPLAEVEVLVPANKTEEARCIIEQVEEK